MTQKNLPNIWLLRAKRVCHQDLSKLALYVHTGYISLGKHNPDNTHLLHKRKYYCTVQEIVGKTCTIISSLRGNIQYTILPRIEAGLGVCSFAHCSFAQNCSFAHRSFPENCYSLRSLMIKERMSKSLLLFEQIAHLIICSFAPQKRAICSKKLE